MAGSNNFKVFDENLTNAFSDAQYATAPQRLNGVVPGIAIPQLHNKMYRQATIMPAAIGELIAEEGGTASDADVTALKESLKDTIKSIGGADRFWKKNTVYSIGDVIYADSITESSKKFECVIAGTSGTAQPIWPSINTTIADGTAVWIVTPASTLNMVLKGQDFINVMFPPIPLVGAKGDGITDDTAILQALIDAGNSLFFPKGIYKITSLKFYWGDTGTDAKFVYRGHKAVIIGTSGITRDYLIDISGQDMIFDNLEFQGLGAFDTTYTTLIRVHTRSSAVGIDKIFMDNCVFRFNHLLVTYGIETDTTAKVSEMFFNNCWFNQAQKIIQNNGGKYIDAIFTACHLSTSVPEGTIDYDNNFIVKSKTGTFRFTGCNFVQTGMNSIGAGAGWSVIFDTGGTGTTVLIDSCTLEWKHGAKWVDGAYGEMVVSNNVNGFCGYNHSDPLFLLGWNCTGWLKLNNAVVRYNADHGIDPVLVDATNSPDFEIFISEDTSLSNTYGGYHNLLARVLGGKYNFPESVIALIYGNTPTTIVSAGHGLVTFSMDWLAAAFLKHRFKGLYADGLITIPSEGLECAWAELQVDWDQLTSNVQLVRYTTLSCNVTSGNNYVEVATSQYFNGNLFMRGVVPGVKVDGGNIPTGTVIAINDFNNNNFKMSEVANGTMLAQATTFIIPVATITKGVLQKIYLGTLYPGDKIGLQLNAVSATTATTINYQRLKLTGKSGMVSQKINSYN